MFKIEYLHMYKIWLLNIKFEKKIQSTSELPDPLDAEEPDVEDPDEELPEVDVVEDGVEVLEDLELTSPHSRLSLIWPICLSSFLILSFCSWTTLRTSPNPGAAAGPGIKTDL